MCTTCFTSMYKNMYNFKCKISLLLLSSITTMLTEIQGVKTSENKKIREMKNNEAKSRQKNGQIWFFFPFPKVSFLGIFLKNQHIHVLVYGHSSWSVFVLHLVRGPKALKFVFLRNYIMEVWPSNWIMNKCHLAWSDFMFHGVNQP